MKYCVRVDGREVEVELAEGPDGLRARLRGRDLPVDLVSVPGGAAFSMLLDGRSHEVQAGEEQGGALDVWLDGLRHRLEVVAGPLRGARAASRSRAAGQDRLRAPMAGVVVEVRVAHGQTVEAGAPLVVVEAMKMRNSLKADAACVVKAVRVAPGDTVAPGQVLLDLAPTGE